MGGPGLAFETWVSPRNRSTGTNRGRFAVTHPNADKQGVSPLALTITGLSKTYPNGVKALKNLSLTIGNNMFGLLGPNGAGKSTLMRTIATLQDPDAGEIQLNGMDVLKDKTAVRKLLGYLPQEFGVYPKISALDMLHHLAVMKGITNRTERNQMVDALLNQTNLWDARKKRWAPTPAA